MTITIHGIKNCDTMKKARAWLEEAGLAHDFHDYKTTGIAPAKLQAWVRQAGWEALLNRAGTTFRKLPEDQKQGLDEARARSTLRIGIGRFTSPADVDRAAAMLAAAWRRAVSGTSRAAE
jgi:Spx/MgsR family transcriptional regulator